MKYKFIRFFVLFFVFFQPMYLIFFTEPPAPNLFWKIEVILEN